MIEFIKQNKVDELIYYQAPKWLGKDALDAIQLGPFNDLIDALQAELTTVEKIGSDVKFVMRLTQKRG